MAGSLDFNVASMNIAGFTRESSRDHGIMSSCWPPDLEYCRWCHVRADVIMLASLAVAGGVRDNAADEEHTRRGEG